MSFVNNDVVAQEIFVNNLVLSNTFRYPAAPVTGAASTTALVEGFITGTVKTLYIAGPINIAATATSSFTFAAGTLPTSFIPISGSASIPVVITNSNSGLTRAQGQIVLGGDGSINIYSGYPATNFTSGNANCGLVGGTVINYV
jgi:hypothetical protein